ncbi:MULTISPECIES: histone deacetylase family protein [unclassified Neisseria]|uniref:histone deacetylase family protein n=1 Tax=unclassified Neisseria TaxID=2623750 RepID=UPI002665F3C8|nr:MULTISPECIES: histone deacetylase family protein [unclassified Neisseria]MDO1509357.1 histone deacetylase family protein [Neisseria sp. MVDL19-042950]MDO1515364.1 histone deacetylase family protein [Neisseria sp. MVDL18-041461]MDO1562724.1 histone deacetylase family protein [Neisseria sp. MVDL20-010259]
MKNIIRRMCSRLRHLAGKKARTAWISHPLFLQHEPGVHHPEAPERIRAIEVELRKQGIWNRLQKMEAEEVTDKQLALVHPRKYLRFLESMQPEKGKIYRIDDDTVMSHESLTAARYAAGAVVNAVDMVMNKRAYHAFCAVRPPGHHAQSDKAGGFCLINNIAVGVMHAIAQYRIQKVAVIDFDVHHGDGTTEIFKDDPRVLLLNSFEKDLFPFPSSETVGKNPHIVNIAFPPDTGSYDFRKEIREKWLPKLAAFKPELLFLSAGFDAHKSDETGRLNLHEADYAWLSHKIIQAASMCKGRIVSVLEGGYTLESLSKSVAAHVYVLAGMGKPDCAVQYDKLLNRQITDNA